MCLAVWPLTGFSGLLQILLLIVSFFLVTAFVITVVLHYRRRKKVPEPVDVQQIVAASPETAQYKVEDEYILFDHSGLIRDYKAKLVKNHARYMALRQDFEQLEEKYNAVLQTGVTPLQTSKPIIMEQTLANNPNEETSVETGKNDLQERLEKLNHAYKELENENVVLTEQLALACMGEEEKLAILGKWKEELKQARNKLSELECVKDLLEEKNTQVEFLQQQLEQRIRNFHVSEKKLNETIEQLENSRHALDETSKNLHHEKDYTEELRNKLFAAETALNNNMQILGSKQDRITYLENLLTEIKDQNEMLQASLADGSEKVANQQQLLDDEQTRNSYLEQKLSNNKRLLQKLFKDLAACVEEETTEPPIVTLRPAYISKLVTEEWEEKAIQ